MKDITTEPYAEWLESSLGELVNYSPKKIAIVAVTGEGATATAYYECSAADKAMLGAVIQQDGMFDRLECNAEWLKGLVDSAEEE